MAHDVDRNYFTVQEVAEHFKVTPRTIRRWVQSGELDGTQTGGPNGSIRIARQSLITQIELSLKRPWALAEKAEAEAEAAEAAKRDADNAARWTAELARRAADEASKTPAGVRLA